MARVGGAIVAMIVVGAGIVGVATVEPAAAAGSTDWKQVDGDSSHTCAVTTAGRLFCWGSDSNGELGNGAGGSSNAPVEVAGATSDWKQVAAGNVHTCAVKTSGRLFCWGGDAKGQIGDGTPGGSAASPTEVTGAATNWKKVTAGAEFSCARKSNGRLYCWGDDTRAQLGDGAFGGNSGTPGQVTGDSKKWSQVAAGGSQVCATRTNDRLYCWGYDTSGQIGDGTVSSPAENPTPTQVSGHAKNWRQIASSLLFTCGRKASGRLLCWGGDANGQLGDGTAGGNSATPGEVSGVLGATNWKQPTGGDGYSCATKTDGRLLCWGSDATQQLGNGAGGASPTPGEVAGAATDWKQVGGGYYHACATKTDGRLFCWGSDFEGQVGDGPAGGSSTSSPVEVAAHP